MKRKIKKKAKRTLKKSVKIALAIFFLVAIAGGSIYYMLWEANNREDPTGTIAEAEEEGEITTIPGAEDIKKSFTYEILNVGQGESIFIDNGDIEILIDVGPIGTTSHISSAIKDKVDGKIEYIVLTNRDISRTGGLSSLLKSFDVENIIVRDEEHKKTLSSIKAEITTIEGRDNATIELGDGFSLSLLTPEVKTDDERDRSIVTYIRYKDTAFLALSDVGKKAEDRIIDMVKSIDVLVAAGHGRADSNYSINALSPRFVVVSAGKGSGPEDALLDRMGNKPIYATHVSGDIIFSSNGSVVTGSFDKREYVTKQNNVEEIEEIEETEETKEETGENE